MSFLYHNSIERKATIIVLVLVVLTWGLAWLWPIFNQSAPKLPQEAIAEIEAFEASIVRKKQERQQKYQYNKYPRKNYKRNYSGNAKDKEEKLPAAEVELFEFDPNTASFDEFKKLGLSARTAHSILNYRESGASFRQKSDLAKIYTLDKEDYNRLADYISLPDSLPERKPRPQYASRDPQPAPQAPQILELNQASAEDLQGLRGIGPAFSRRIVRYRQSLGGFIKIEQLAEVYGLPDSTFQSIRQYLTCQPAVKKLNINKATAEELKSHPYLSWRHANAIVNWRKKHGAYKDPEFLRTLFEFDDGKGTYWKIAPYLSVN